MEGKNEIIVEMSEMCLRALHSVHELELTVSFVQKHRALLPFLSTATYSFGRPSKAQVFFHCSAQNAVLLIQPQSLRPRTGKKTGDKFIAKRHTSSNANCPTHTRRTSDRQPQARSMDHTHSIEGSLPTRPVTYIRLIQAYPSKSLYFSPLLSNAASNRCITPSTFSSSSLRPMTCTPTGRPAIFTAS
jgi:hypothetical protein